MRGIDEGDDGPILLVCVPGRKSDFKDDVLDTCVFCGTEVHHRPNAPTPHRACCLDCFLKRREPDDKLLVTKTSIQEALAKLRH